MRAWPRRATPGSAHPGATHPGSNPGADRGEIPSRPGARDEVLARVRAALGDRPVPPPVPRDYRQTGGGSASLPPDAPAEAVVDLLVDRLVDYRALVRRVAPRPGEDAVAGAVAAALAGQGVRRLVRPPDLPTRWLAGLPAEVELLGDDPPLSARALDTVDGVLTGCAMAIAETGTLVLDGGPGQGRRALTLIPDYHLVVVREDQIVASVADAIARLGDGGVTRPLTWISGPSATSDIELNRVEGVHGPRTLEVIVVTGR